MSIHRSPTDLQSVVHAGKYMTTFDLPDYVDPYADWTPISQPEQGVHGLLLPLKRSSGGPKASLLSKETKIVGLLKDAELSAMLLGPPAQTDAATARDIRMVANGPEEERKEMKEKIGLKKGDKDEEEREPTKMP